MKRDIGIVRRILLVIVVAMWSAILPAAERPVQRVLVIGIDGCRTDALKAGKLPNLHSLIADGAFSEATQIVGPRSDTADTVSGPGWSNVLTGVWPDKHGVLDNNFKVMHYDEFPHFFRHLKQVFPGARTGSYCTWPPIAERIVSGADESLCFYGDDKEVAYRQADDKCTAKVVEVLTQGDPDALFFYQLNVDGNGHKHGFHPSVPEYREALEHADEQIGRVLKALRARPRFAREGWLILVATDHGGLGKTHVGGREIPQTNTVWLIVSGAGVQPGPIEGRTQQVDVVATALQHLGVPL